MLWNSSTNILQQVDIASNDYTNIITNVLLPIWKRSSNFDGTSGDYGFPRYKFETSFSNADHQSLQGTLTDSVYTDGAEHLFSQSIGTTSGTYYRARYGSGSTTIDSTNFLVAYVPTGAVRTV